MIVIITAKTPSLKASMRPFVIVSLLSCRSAVILLLESIVQERLPVVRNFPRRTGRGLSHRMRMRRRQLGAADHSLPFIIEEPVLAGFEAGDHRMSRFRRVFGGMLAGRTIAAANVSTLCAPPQVK